MLTITVRRHEHDYTVKAVGQPGFVTLPRPLTPESGLHEDLIEKIVTCKKEETRELSMPEVKQIQKFGTPIHEPLPAAKAVKEPVLDVLTQTLRTAYEAMSLTIECKMCKLPLDNGTLFFMGGTHLVCGECYQFTVEQQMEAQQAAYYDLKQRLSTIKQQRGQ